MKNPIAQDDKASKGKKPYLRGPFGQLLSGLRKETLEAYRDRLVTLTVLGSVGRATATAESDVGLLVIATDLPRGRVKRVTEFAQVENRIHPLIKEMKHGGTPIYPQSLRPLMKCWLAAPCFWI